MDLQELSSFQKICIAISELKQQLVEELPHYGNQSLYFKNDEITTGLINNKTEIKIHLITGQLLYFHDEKGFFIDLFNENIEEKFEKIVKNFGLNLPQTNLENTTAEFLSSYRGYAKISIEILELFRMTLREDFTQIHLWPHHFDFSVEWFTGNADEQIGTGISPGDKDNLEPYVYMNPYPFNEKILEENLPIGRWNTLGWKGVKIQWNDLLKLSPQEASDKLKQIFDISKKNFS